MCRQSPGLNKKGGMTAGDSKLWTPEREKKGTKRRFIPFHFHPTPGKFFLRRGASCSQQGGTGTPEILWGLPPPPHPGGWGVVRPPLLVSQPHRISGVFFETIFAAEGPEGSSPPHLSGWGRPPPNQVSPAVLGDPTSQQFFSRPGAPSQAAEPRYEAGIKFSTAGLARM